METKDEHNKVREPELAYGQRRKTTKELMTQEPWLQGFLRQLPEELERLDNPVPVTIEEYRAEIGRTQARIDAGEKGISLEELTRRAQTIKSLYYADMFNPLCPEGHLPLTQGGEG